MAAAAANSQSGAAGGSSQPRTQSHVQPSNMKNIVTSMGTTTTTASAMEAQLKREIERVWGEYKEFDQVVGTAHRPIHGVALTPPTPCPKGNKPPNFVIGGDDVSAAPASATAATTTTTTTADPEPKRALFEVGSKTGAVAHPTSASSAAAASVSHKIKSKLLPTKDKLVSAAADTSSSASNPSKTTPVNSKKAFKSSHDRKSASNSSKKHASSSSPKATTAESVRTDDRPLTTAAKSVEYGTTATTGVIGKRHTAKDSSDKSNSRSAAAGVLKSNVVSKPKAASSQLDDDLRLSSSSSSEGEEDEEQPMRPTPPKTTTTSTFNQQPSSQQNPSMAARVAQPASTTSDGQGNTTVTSILAALFDDDPVTSKSGKEATEERKKEKHKKKRDKGGSTNKEGGKLLKEGRCTTNTDVQSPDSGYVDGCSSVDSHADDQQQQQPQQLSSTMPKSVHPHPTLSIPSGKEKRVSSIMKEIAVAPLLSPVRQFPPLVYLSPPTGRPSLMCRIDLKALNDDAKKELAKVQQQPSTSSYAPLPHPSHSSVPPAAGAVTATGVDESKRQQQSERTNNDDSNNNNNNNNDNNNDNSSSSKAAAKAADSKLVESTAHAKSSSKSEKGNGSKVKNEKKREKEHGTKKKKKRTNEQHDTTTIAQSCSSAKVEPANRVDNSNALKSDSSPPAQAKSAPEQQHHKDKKRKSPCQSSDNVPVVKQPRIEEPSASVPTGRSSSCSIKTDGPPADTFDVMECAPSSAVVLEMDVSGQLLDPNYYQNQRGRPIKKTADKETDKLCRALLYLESVVYFVLAIRALECSQSAQLQQQQGEDPTPSPKICTMLRDTCDLLRHVTGRFVKAALAHELGPAVSPLVTRVHAMSLRVQSVLFYRMYSYRQPTVLRNYQRLHTVTSSTSASSSATPTTAAVSNVSPSSANKPAVAQSTQHHHPNVSSPTESGYATGGSSSTGGSSGRQQNSTPSPSPSPASCASTTGGVPANHVLVPLEVDQLQKQQLSFLHQLMHSHQCWKDSSAKLTSTDNEFFSHLDTLCGRLHMESSLVELSTYVATAVKWLKAEYWQRLR